MTDSAIDPDARLIPWETFQSAFLKPAIGAEVPVVGDPPLAIVVEPGGVRLSLRLPSVSGEPPETGLRSIRLRGGARHLTLTAEDRQLFQAFYALMLDISDRIQIERAPVLEAVEDALRVWRRLLAGLGGLTHEEQLGLSGELWALLRRLDAVGPSGVESWTGPLRQAHDFRFDSDEVEVKTTSGERRRHRISRLEQLQPSPDRSLWLLSIQLARAGALEGWTLHEQISAVRDRLDADEARRRRFSDLLALTKWNDEDAGIYPDRWQLRSVPVVVPVDASCPRITRPFLENVLGDSAVRVDDVLYRVDLDGLGHPDGTEAFVRLFPQR